MERRVANVVVALGAIFSLNVSQGQVTWDELLAAEEGKLSAVKPEDLPIYGTFFSWQKPWQAPAPANFFPELTVYDLGYGRFLMDDRDLDCPLVNALAALMTESEGGEPAQMMMAEGVGEGCGLWLSISRNTSSNVVLTLHNTRPAQNYVVWSLTNLALTNWVVETNVTGASGNLTDVLVAMLGRTNLFLKATEYRDYQVDTNATFSGLGYANTAIDPPDSMGAVGPEHFVELLNGDGANPSIAVYTKSGTLVAWTNTLDFFRIDSNYPSGYRMVDPRILYDHQAQRWIACAIDVTDSQQVLLAVSNGDSPTNLATGWSRYLVDARRNGIVTDFTTLGLDGNGLYISVSHWLGTNAGQTVVAIKKPEIYQGILITNRFEIYVTNTLPVWVVQPAVNFDDVATNDYAWFVAKGPPDLSTNYQGGAIYYRRMQWNGTNTAWAEDDWIAVTNSSATYRDYYDLDGTNTFDIVVNGTAVYAPSKDGIALNLHVVGSRLAMTSIHASQLA
jgi:chitodextrinase